MRAQRGRRGIGRNVGVGGQRHASAALPPRKRPDTQFYRTVGGPQGRCGRVQKISPTPRFDPLTVQLVASGYTD